MNFDDYRNLSALNWSSLRDMHESPLLYHYRETHPRPDSPAMALGRLVHLAVLEPERYAEACVSRPAEWDSWRTKAAKDWRAEQEEAGRVVLDDETAATVACITEALDAHPAVRLLDGTRREETIQWEVEDVACKGRLDAVCDDRVVDLKTCRGISRFSRDAAEHLYHGQLAWYLDGAILAGSVEPDAEVYMIAVETSEPYDVAGYRLPPEVLSGGRRLYRALLDRWLSCRELGAWPGRHPAITDLELPPWAEYVDGGEW